MSAKIAKIEDGFEFEQNGKTYRIPSFKDLPTGALRRARSATDDLDKAFLIVEGVLGEDSPELKAIDRMTISEFGEFVKAWTQGAPVGES
jgi:hypothetical protein